MTDTKQPEALRLADAMERLTKSSHWWTDGEPIHIAVAAELRSLHTENETLRAGYDAARLEIASLQGQLEAVGAGGVGRLVGATQRLDRETSQFLSDVMTAAGLVEHGKQCKALAERVANGCRTLRTALAAAAPAPPIMCKPPKSWNKRGQDAYRRGWEAREAALAAAVPAQPVALVSQETFNDDGTSDIIIPALPIGMALYAASQPDAQNAAQNPLTTEEIDALCTQVGFTAWPEWDGDDYQSMWYELAQAIEAAHGITEPEAAGTPKEVVLMEFRFGPKNPEPDQPESLPLTQDEIVSMALEADPWGTNGRLAEFALLRPSTLLRFAALVTAAERRACAAACEKVKQRAESAAKSSFVTDAGAALHNAMAAAAHNCMLAIAARGSNGH